MTIYSLDVLLSTFGTSSIIPSQGTMMNDSSKIFSDSNQMSVVAFSYESLPRSRIHGLFFFLKPWHILGKGDLEMFSLGGSLWLYFPGGSDGKESTYNVGDLGSIPGLGRSPGEANWYSLQYSCLENSMDRWAWQATYSPWGSKELDTTVWLTLFTLWL